MVSPDYIRRLGLLALCGVLAAAGCRHLASGTDPSRGGSWYKGNLHSHTMWSDGKEFPEMAAAWYKDRGYDFLCLSDHNVLSIGEKWENAESKRAAGGLEACAERFGGGGLEFRQHEGQRQVRLKPLDEIRPLLEQPGRFLLVQGEEITHGKAHLNGVNLLDVVPPRDGSTVADVIANNIEAVSDQSRRTGRPMFVQLNHPNYRWMVTAEDMAAVAGLRFFEVYNGIAKTNMRGDDLHAGTERVWDIVLALRLARLGLPVVYGTATDDAHHYRTWGIDRANPGRGWVVVKAPRLEADSIVEAMEAGRFYASSGVVLRDIEFDGRTLAVRIRPEPGVSYSTRFIGTLKGCDLSSRPVVDKEGNEVNATRIYSDEIGRTLKEVEGTIASYRLTGEELYVRAKITSSRPKENPSWQSQFESAWVQPVVPAGFQALMAIEPNEANRRNSEGDIVELADGRLCLVYTRYTDGKRDHSPAVLAMRTSADGGRTWSGDRILVPNEGKCNVMSVSILRLDSGELLLFYSRTDEKLRRSTTFVRRSDDEFRTLGDPVRVTWLEGYHVVNNDRVLKLSTGRLIVPAGLHTGFDEAGRITDFSSKAVVMTYYSDDGGRTWQRSRTEITPVDKRELVLQEPGVVELKDGRLWMYMRTSHGFQYGCHSGDGGVTWSKPRPTPLASPLSPATIERIPWTGDLLCVWNDHSGAHPFPEGRRAPLCAAISSDEGLTWRPSRVIEGDPGGWFCYTSMTFLEDRVLLAYCAGDRQVGRLSRLKVTALSRDWIYGGADTD